MVSTLNVRSNSHNSCEDSLHVVETETYIDGIISDGCSTGIKSHFASQAICYAFANHGRRDDYTDDWVINHVRKSLLMVSELLNLTSMNLLATCMLFHYNKLDKTLTVRVFGDGSFFVDGVEYTVDQNNTPDYLGYHIMDSYADFQEYLKKYPKQVFHKVDRFMICSDGIDRIERSQFAPEPKSKGYSILYSSPKSANYLERMWNILKRDHYTLSDDLSIISYVS